MRTCSECKEKLPSGLVQSIITSRGTFLVCGRCALKIRKMEIPSSAGIMKFLLIVCFLCLSGCGWFGRETAKAFGYAEYCVDQVKYLQFASGATVKYNQNGTIANCP